MYKGLEMKTNEFFIPTTLAPLKRTLCLGAVITGLCFGAVLPSSVNAQPAPGMSMGGEQGMGMHDMHDMHDMNAMHPGPMNPAKLEKIWQHRMEHFEAHMAMMKKRLEITSAQEAAWNQFVTAMRPTAKPEQMALSPGQWHETMQLKAPERMEKMIAMHESRHAQMLVHMQQHLEAVKAFYPQLSDSQQKLFDKLSAHPWGRRAGWQHP
jgi:LTXXQ motif family protein